MIVRTLVDCYCYTVTKVSGVRESYAVFCAVKEKPGLLLFFISKRLFDR